MKHTKKVIGINILILLIILFNACKKDNSTGGNNSQKTIKGIIGYAQKGPFLSGSAVTVYDLNQNLSPSGKSYNTQIIDNKGTFELSELAFSSSYISIRADGFYFNEVLNKNSSSQITLYAISDISDSSNININLLTHLEKARVENLIKSGKTFKEAKKQAQREVLAIFNIESDDIRTSENLNISESGDDNGILLAVSAILQGYRTESELTVLLSNIIEDIKGDGVLNNLTIGSELINHAIYLDTSIIRNNLTEKYNELGVTANIPNFGKYITGFITKPIYPITKTLFNYPDKGMYGENVLTIDKISFTRGAEFVSPYSLAVNLHNGTSLKIKITSLTHTNQSDTSDVSTYAYCYYTSGTSVNWSVSVWDNETHSQVFKTIETGKSTDLQMYFDIGSFLIEYYEMNSSKPTYSKTVIFTL